MEKTEVLYGFHSVIEAFNAGRRTFLEIYISGDKDTGRMAPVIEQAQRKNIPVKTLSPDKMRTVAQTDKHQNVAASVGAYPYAALLSPEKADGNHPPFYLMLDHILDPQNLGAILRTAHCVGVDQVIIPKDRSAGATPAVSRASAGALEHIRLVRVTNLVNSIKELKQEDVWVMGLDREGKSVLYSMDFTAPVCLVIGGEDQGIRPLVKKFCDALISIPQIGGFNSLNASVAGAVVLYEAFRQRYSKQKE